MVGQLMTNGRQWTDGMWNNTLKGMLLYTGQSKYYPESILNHITILQVQ